MEAMYLKIIGFTQKILNQKWILFQECNKIYQNMIFLMPVIQEIQEQEYKSKFWFPQKSR
jgi:hypothetical protein